MFTSLRARLFLSYAIVVGVALCVVAVVTLIYLANNPLQIVQARIRLQSAAEAVLERSEALDGLGQLTLPALVQRVDEIYGLRVLVFEANGSVIADSRGDSAPILVLSANEITTSLERVRVTPDAENDAWLYLARPLSERYWLVLATPRPETTFWAAVRSRSDDLARPLRQGALVALLLSLGLAFGISHWVAAPLKRIAASADRVVEGNFAPLQPAGPTEVRRLTTAINDMAAQVQAGQQSQRDFIANVSHELKTPLTSIQGFAQAIMDGTAQTPDELRAASRVIHTEAGRMHRLVLDLLDLARLDAGTFTFRRAPLELDALLHAVVQKLTPQAQAAEVQLQTQIHPLPQLIGDGDRLAQVFTNLVDNAIKHSPAGGQVTLVAAAEATTVRISVTDTGPGIPEAELERVFERFYQVDKSRPGGRQRGAGLGLAIAHELVAAHQGTLRVTSATGQGSTFVVKLPIVRADGDTLTALRPAKKR